MLACLEKFFKSTKNLELKLKTTKKLIEKFEKEIQNETDCDVLNYLYVILHNLKTNYGEMLFPTPQNRKRKRH